MGPLMEEFLLVVIKAIDLETLYKVFVHTFGSLRMSGAYPKKKFKLTAQCKRVPKIE